MQDYKFSPNQVIQDFICQQLLKWQDIKKTKQNNCMNVTEKLKVAENYQILLLFRREHLKPVEFNLLS